MKKIIKYIGILLIPFSLMIASCSSDDDDPIAPELTIIYNIKMLNAGASGTEVLVGTVDENKKKISFPEIDPETDLSRVRFETELPEGATMDEDEYDFTIAEGKTSITRIVAVVNGKRKREYYATISLDLPVWGADFSEEKMIVHDFSANSTMYPDLSDATTRCADMDINHVLMVSRTATGPHLLKLEDLKKKEINPIKLDLTGVSGGTFAYSGGGLAQGHIYICNMATPSTTAPLKVYHWASPTATPELIASVFSTDLTGYGAGRFGDYMSVDLNENGDGFMFFGVNGNQTDYKVLRLKVEGFTNVSQPTLINVATYAGLWGSYTQVDGSPDDYIYSGHQGPIMVVNSGGTIQHTVSASYIPNIGGSDARVITFNNERYLVMFATPGAGSINVYDVTEGSSITEALTLMEEENRMPLVQYSLGGAIANGTAAGSIGWAKDGDETLYIFGGGPGAGFAILECPKKVKGEDPEED